MKKYILGTAILMVIILLGLGFTLMQQFAPPPGPAPTHADIAYAPADPAGSAGHLLDLYLPKSSEFPPLVIFSGGSAWMSDNGKDFAAWLAPALNDAGIALAGVSIRSSSQATFPAQLHDIKSAIRWLRLHSSDYGFDGNRIAVMGDSSGGWMAAMAGATGDVPALEGSVGTVGVSSVVQAVIALYPPTRFTEMDENAVGPCTPDAGMMGMILGKIICHDDDTSPESVLIDCPIQSCPEQALLADPTQYISVNDPPFLIMHGGVDPLVPHAQGELLYATLSSNCHDAIFISLPNAGHGPAPDFLSDDTVREGATRQSTMRNDCSVSAPESYSPDVNTIIEFLQNSLGEKSEL